MSISSVTNPGADSGAARIDKIANSPAANERQILTASGKVLPQSDENRPSRAAVVQALDDISQYLQSQSRDLHFQLDENISGPIITVLDHETSEIVRQIPTEEVIDVARYIAENRPDPLKGLLLDGNG